MQHIKYFLKLPVAGANTFLQLFLALESRKSTMVLSPLLDLERENLSFVCILFGCFFKES